MHHERVAWVMRSHLPGLRLRRRVHTTVPEPANGQSEDLVKRDFTAAAPSEGPHQAVGPVLRHPSCGFLPHRPPGYYPRPTASAASALRGVGTGTGTVRVCSGTGRPTK